MKCNFILYVKDQKKSRDFYQVVLGVSPTLDVAGMTEFQIASDTVLGLMPETGIKRLLGDAISDPEESNGVSRCELYLIVDDPELYLNRAVAAGGKLLSPLQKRNWGDKAAYVMDFDGHIIAFASSN